VSGCRIGNGAAVSRPDAVLELLRTAETSGSICALLTPAIKAKMRELEPGQVLQVRVDDPSACLDVQAWCRLTGNSLQAASEQNGVFSFFIEKQDKRQEVQGNG
jgi:tRNA 2-thiouridine synthesizing protein A